MAKKEPIKVQDINYSSSGDSDKLMKLFKHIGPFYGEQQDLIWEMLKKYIDPNHPRPLAGCNCPLSYANAFNGLREWFSKNNIN